MGQNVLQIKQFVQKGKCLQMPSYIGSPFLNTCQCVWMLLG